MTKTETTRGPLCADHYKKLGAWDPQQFEFVTPPQCMRCFKPAAYSATFLTNQPNPHAEN